MCAPYALSYANPLRIKRLWKPTQKQNWKHTRPWSALRSCGAPASLSLDEQLDLLAAIDTRKRIEHATKLFAREKNLNELSQEITRNVEQDLDDTDRRQFLREQIPCSET